MKNQKLKKVPENTHSGILKEKTIEIEVKKNKIKVKRLKK